MKDNNLKKNVITGFGGQFIAIILGIIVPRLLINSYGSDVNGLLSTITQIFTYMALLEAGVGQSARNLLYKPFQEKNIEKISEISSIARNYFRKFTIIYAIGVAVLAFALPFVFKTNVDALTVALIVIFEGLSGVISFYFIETSTIIIGVDGKNYINNSISLFSRIAGYAVKIVMATFGVNIVILQFFYFIVTVLRVFIYKLYFKKHYDWIHFKKFDSNVKLKDRNSYILTELCWTIFSSTDMIVLSIFVSTKLSSVYGIYNIIFANITLLINSVFSSITYLLGYAYHENIEKYKKMHDSFNSIFMGVITALMSVCYILTIPFIKLYTKGVTDVNYLYGSLPILFCLIQLISWSRYTSGHLTGISGYAKKTSYISLIEAILNVTFSILLVKKFGIVGVTLATVIALPIKVVWCTYIADKKVMNRSFLKSVSIIGINFMFFFGVVFVSNYIRPEITTIFQFAFWGLVLSVVFGTMVMALNFGVNKECGIIVKRYILKK